MKRLIEKLLKRKGYKLMQYRSGRSDMGCQYFDFYVYKEGEPLPWKSFCDSYFAGEQGMKEKMRGWIIEFINNLP